MIYINDTIRFILPMFYSPVDKLNKDFFLRDNLVGVFTSDINKPEHDDKLLLTYLYFPEEEYIEFENRIKVLLNPIIYETSPDVYVYVVDIPKEYKEDYILISSGLYHKISPDLKLKIIKMWSLEPEDTLFKVLIGEEEYEGEDFENEILK